MRAQAEPTHSPPLHRAMRARMALILLLPLALLCCEKTQQTKTKTTSLNAKASSPGSSTGGGSTQTTPRDPNTHEKTMLGFVGKACSVDRDCPGYLRCLPSTCAIPPAVTGEGKDNAPSITFFATPKMNGEPRSSFAIEVVKTPPQRRRGLMYRRKMQPGWGMLFIYPRDQPMSFWMENTYIPLDMVFINTAGKVVDVIAHAEPMTRTQRTSKADCAYVLELNAGVAAKSGITADNTWASFDKVNLHDAAPAP